MPSVPDRSQPPGSGPREAHRYRQVAESFGTDPERYDRVQWRFDWDRSFTRDEWLDQVPTFGGHGQLPQATLRQLTAGIGGAIDAVGGSFAVGYSTVVVTAMRNGSTIAAAAGTE